MSALIVVEWCSARFPSWAPYRVAVLDIEVSPVVVHRHVVVTIASDASELSVFVEAVPSCCVGYEGEEVLISKIVDPRPWGLWVGDDILTVVVFEMSVSFFHFYKLMITIVSYQYCWQN